MNHEPVRLRVTLTYEYDAEPDYYGTDNPTEMAAIDQREFIDDPTAVVVLAEAYDYSITVDVVE